MPGRQIRSSYIGSHLNSRKRSASHRVTANTLLSAPPRTFANLCAHALKARTPSEPSSAFCPCSLAPFPGLWWDQRAEHGDAAWPGPGHALRSRGGSCWALAWPALLARAERQRRTNWGGATAHLHPQLPRHVATPVGYSTSATAREGGHHEPPETCGQNRRDQKCCTDPEVKKKEDHLV